MRLGHYPQPCNTSNGTFLPSLPEGKATQQLLSGLTIIQDGSCSQTARSTNSEKSLICFPENSDSSSGCHLQVVSLVRANPGISNVSYPAVFLGFHPASSCRMLYSHRSPK